MATELNAPMSGKIIKISVEVGATVEEDDEMLVLEAMKMENPVYAPCDGKVTEIKTAEGKTVEEDDVLMLIEEG